MKFFHLTFFKFDFFISLCFSFSFCFALSLSCSAFFFRISCSCFLFSLSFCLAIASLFLQVCLCLLFLLHLLQFRLLPSATCSESLLATFLCTACTFNCRIHCFHLTALGPFNCTSLMVQ
nr:MAG: hypothetical protein CM15mV30_0330 [uncultured marine virus]